MKILFISDASPFGGASNAMLMLAAALKKRGCDIYVCLGKAPELKKSFEDINIKAIELDYIPAIISKPHNKTKGYLKLFLFYILRKFITVPNALKRIEETVDIATFDIIHTNSARSDLGCLLARKYKLPHVVHLREFYSEGFDFIYLKKNYIEYLNENSDAFIAISNAVKKNWMNNGLNEKKIIRLYDGIDTNYIKPHKIMDKEKNQLKIVIVGSIVELKGQHICIEALHLLPPDIQQNVFLDIIGWEDASYRKQLNKMVKQYTLNNNIRFLGIKNNIGDLLCDYDIGIMASRAEGFGLVTAEYMAAGLCVIASNAGANGELITNNVSGFLFERNNANDLSQCIIKLYNNRELLYNLSVCGKERVCREFTIERNADEIYCVYEKLL